MLLFSIAGIIASASLCSGRPAASSDIASLYPRQASSSNSSLEVDLGYSVYRGVNNATSQLNNWRGVRFAAPPTGQLRWQLPQAPRSDRSSPIDASQYAPTCYQSGNSAGGAIRPGNQSLAAEDCLFLNVWSPAAASEPLPVFVWIHGGGYGAGSGRQDMTPFINANNNSLVAVTIQYRLGAFGFLSSDEVNRNGIPNAGLYDQTFGTCSFDLNRARQQSPDSECPQYVFILTSEIALEWVQSYIHLFGGDPTRVTIGGESAGGGSVMLQDMAYGGTLGNKLFTNTFSASPYLPMQYGYADWVPSQAYYAFATAVGCPPDAPYNGQGQTVFQCLVSADSALLANASATVSQEGVYGTWGFLPVTDGRLVQDLPSRQLLEKKVNGQNALVGNNANEGPSFVAQNITTEDDLVAFLGYTFPLFSDSDIQRVLLYYPSSNASDSESAPVFATEGESGPTALNQSSVGTGQQQRANNIYAETTFVCPSYWQVEAYSDPARNRSGYKYQFSVPPATHGADVAAYFSPPGGVISSDFSQAFKQIVGNFVIQNNPSIPAAVANGANATISTNAVSSWPPFSIDQPYQIDLNQTGGTPTTLPVPGIRNITVNSGMGAQNNITLVNAYTWEGGRGQRCDFWRSVGAIVPE
jgi:carboxylesterase type B